jgi:hypothetical protein
MASVPLLPTSQPHYGSAGNDLNDAQVKSQLQKTANMRKIGLKVCAVLFCPISFACAIPPCSPCCRSCCGLDGNEKDNQNVPYCEWTACKLNHVWNSRLPPDDWCCSVTKHPSLASYVCDPCVLCFCCADEGLENYLLPAERDAYTQAEERVSNQLSFAPAPPQQSMNTSLSQRSVSPLRLHMVKFLIQIPSLLKGVQGIDHANYKKGSIPKAIVQTIFEFAASPPPPSNLRNRDIAPRLPYSPSPPPRDYFMPLGFV